MNKYRFVLEIVVEAEAFDQDDAGDLVRDTFGLGEQCGLNITESEIVEVKTI